MIIYQNNVEHFVDHVRTNQIAQKISESFEHHFRHKPSNSERESWVNSLSRVRDLIEIAELKDNHLVVEYEVPYNKSRIDCLIFGKDKDGRNNAVLIELKQWSEAKATEDEGNFVETYLGGSKRMVPHPSQQAKGYRDYLLSYVAEFEAENPLVLHSFAYCHNYRKTDKAGLFDDIYRDLLEEVPLYAADDNSEFAERLKTLLNDGKGTELFNRFMLSEIRPSKKLLENVSKVISNERVFSLIDNQLVAKNLIWSKLRKNLKDKTKSVIIVHGGPGTGKSVIALNVLAEAASKNYKVYWGCKSLPFRSGIQNLVGNQNIHMFGNLYRYIPTKIGENDADVLFIDESHRIEKTSNHRFTRRADMSDMPQIDQLIRCARTSVFFIDDQQSVRKSEIGSSKIITEAAKKHGIKVSEVHLKNQFRCMGSNDYLEWLSFILGYSTQEKILKKSELFEFKIFDSPGDLYRALEEKERGNPNSARLTAGFCWQWSRNLDENGEFVKDVVIKDFAMPWETHGDITPPRGYVSWEKWAIRPEGFKQVGCIYTAQGFEFEYIGVIIADDLRFDADTDTEKLVSNQKAHKDPTLKRNTTVEEFDVYVRNIYRVLLSRGLKGCFVYFVNPETRKYVERFLEQ